MGQSMLLQFGVRPMSSLGVGEFQDLWRASKVWRNGGALVVQGEDLETRADGVFGKVISDSRFPRFRESGVETSEGIECPLGWVYQTSHVRPRMMRCKECKSCEGTGNSQVHSLICAGSMIYETDSMQPLNSSRHRSSDRHLGSQFQE